MSTLTSKNAIATPALTDVIHVVDVSDVTGSAQGTSKKMTLAQVQAVVTPATNFAGGILDYNDAGTTTVPITVAAATPTVLTNDEAGAFTNKTYLPAGVTDVWLAGTDTFDWSELKLGDMIDIRLDVDVITTLNNTETKIDLILAIGGVTYAVPWQLETNYKSSGTHKVNVYNGIYIGDTNTLDNGARFEITSDNACTVVVNGWYVKVITRG